MKYEIHFGTGQVPESFNTLEAARARIDAEYPKAQWGSDWQPSATGYEGLFVRVGPLDVDVHEIRKEA